MKKTHQWMLFFLFLFFAFTSTACTKNTEKLVFYRTTKATDQSETLEFFSADFSKEKENEETNEEETKAVETSLAQTQSVSMITVYLCGQVCIPGVYTLEEGSRLYQAVEMAGGLTSKAQAEAVNLARILSDSEQIYIPDVSETVALTSAMSNPSKDEMVSYSVSNDSAAFVTSGTLVNINQASVSELMQLPGIGQVKAEAIIAYRNSNGLFSSIEEIKNVPGIKEAAFEKIKGMITVF